MLAKRRLRAAWMNTMRETCAEMLSIEFEDTVIIPNTMLVVFIVAGNVLSSKPTSQHTIYDIHRDEYQSTWRRIKSARRCGNADDAVRCQGLSLRFNAEDPKNFEKRVETCRARKAWRCDCEQM